MRDQSMFHRISSRWCLRCKHKRCTGGNLCRGCGLSRGYFLLPRNLRFNRRRCNHVSMRERRSGMPHLSMRVWLQTLRRLLVFIISGSILLCRCHVPGRLLLRQEQVWWIRLASTDRRVSQKKQSMAMDGRQVPSLGTDCLSSAEQWQHAKSLRSESVWSSPGLGNSAHPSVSTRCLTLSLAVAACLVETTSEAPTVLRFSTWTSLGVSPESA